MNLPVEPSTMPPVRKYTRTFEADRTKVYREGDQIKIHIPPIANTYLTKNSKLYFDFDLTYNMYTTTEIQNIATAFEDGSVYDSLGETAAYMFGKVIDINGNAVDSTYAKEGRMLTKPFPTFDINGAYGLFNRIQVHDYLGTTLLEDIERHDMLTAILADFDFTTEDIEVLRPTAVQFSDKFINQNVYKSNCALPFNGYDDFTGFLQENIPLDIDMINTAINSITVNSTQASIPTYHACINLYSFLGKFSNNFVPLHNGFTITLFVNKIDIPISYSNTYSPNNSHSSILFPVEVTPSLTLTPSTVSHSITNIKYKCDLLELSSELDSSVDKELLVKSYKYQRDIKNDNNYNITKRILPSVKSIRKVMISQQLKDIQTVNLYRDLSFRYKNGVKTASLLYNKASICSSTDTIEHYEMCKNSFGKTINNFYDISCFEDNASNKGYQNLMTYSYLSAINMAVPPETGNQGNITTPEAQPNSLSNGKFMIVFDTRIPGTSESSISGIDTSNNNLEYNIVYDPDDTFPSFLDVFLECDAVVHVDPGKSTSVSF